MTDHYFSPDPTVRSKPRTITVSLAGREVEVSTDAGTFSPSRLDPGTQVLLRNIPRPTPGDILDLGCGWGPISLHAGIEAREDGIDASVWALDVNRRSLELTKQNAAALGLGMIRTVTAEEIPDELRFSQILSNPPIRVGKDVLHGLLRTWVTRLVPGGSAWLVVSKNLGADSLAAWLEGELNGSLKADGGSAELRWTVTRAASSKGFRVLRVVRPDKA